MSLILNTKRLQIRIAEPGIAPDTTIRFDRAGFIEQITLDGKYHFCGMEPHNLVHPSSGGVGICNEFRCQKPIDEAKLGEVFPKWGVGLLEKKENKFFFYLPCREEPFLIDIEKTENGYGFLTREKKCNGYAAVLYKKVEAIDNRILMTEEFENVGDKDIDFTEYCHNFLTLDYLPIGPSFHLDMPVADQTGKALKQGYSLCGCKGGYTFSAYSNEASLVDIAKEELLEQEGFWWKLYSEDSPLTITEKVSFAPEKVAVWAIDHVVSPQIHVAYTVHPGERKKWIREWTFTD